jgi:hypothetical protein
MLVRSILFLVGIAVCVLFRLYSPANRFLILQDAVAVRNIVTAGIALGSVCLIEAAVTARRPKLGFISWAVLLIGVFGLVSEYFGPNLDFIRL